MLWRRMITGSDLQVSKLKAPLVVQTVRTQALSPCTCVMWYLRFYHSTSKTKKGIGPNLTW